MPTFSDLARAAFCPRQLYYARQDEDRGPPAAVRNRIDLAFEYQELSDAPDRELRTRPIERRPASYRRNLRRLQDRPAWDALVDPAGSRVFLEGKDCRGVAHKVLEGVQVEPVDCEQIGVGDSKQIGVGDSKQIGVGNGEQIEPGSGVQGDLDDGDGEGNRDDDGSENANSIGHGKSITDGDDGDDTETGAPPPIPTIVSPGTPPSVGVWEPQTVRAVAVAKALAWERQRTIPRTLVEYPTIGIVRTVPITTRRKAVYRRWLRTVRAIDGPPPRRTDDRCESCEYRETCGVRTESLRSRLGL